MSSFSVVKSNLTRATAMGSALAFAAGCAPHNDIKVSPSDNIAAQAALDAQKPSYQMMKVMVDPNTGCAVALKDELGLAGQNTFQLNQSRATPFAKDPSACGDKQTVMAPPVQAPPKTHFETQKVPVFKTISVDGCTCHDKKVFDHYNYVQKLITEPGQVLPSQSVVVAVPESLGNVIHSQSEFTAGTEGVARVGEAAGSILSGAGNLAFGLNYKPDNTNVEGGSATGGSATGGTGMGGAGGQGGKGGESKSYSESNPTVVTKTNVTAEGGAGGNAVAKGGSSTSNADASASAHQNQDQQQQQKQQQQQQQQQKQGQKQGQTWDDGCGCWKTSFNIDKHYPAATYALVVAPAYKMAARVA